MMGQKQIARKLLCSGFIVAACAGFCFAVDSPAAANAGKLPALLQRTGEQMSEYVERFSDVRCSEKVT